jgi:hypothetical protein
MVSHEASRHARPAPFRPGSLDVMRSADAQAKIAEFLGRYSREIEAQLREARSALRSVFPRGYELVFDNYNALVFGISPTERSADAFVSVAGYSRWVTLFFLRGAELEDPHGLLQGAGKLVRGIRLTAMTQVNTPEVSSSSAFLRAEPGEVVASLCSQGTYARSISAAQRACTPNRATNMTADTTAAMSTYWPNPSPPRRARQLIAQAPTTLDPTAQVQRCAGSRSARTRCSTANVIRAPGATATSAPKSTTRPMASKIG